MDTGETEQPIVKVPLGVAFLAWTLILGGVVVAVLVIKEVLTAYLDVGGNFFFES